MVALCVMGSVPKSAPTEVGAKRTPMRKDFPGPRLNGPAPITTEKGLAGLPTVPVRGAVEVGRFVRVRGRTRDLPTTTLLNSKGSGLTRILITGDAPVPFTVTVQLVAVTAVQPVTFVALWVRVNVSENGPRVVGEKSITTLIDCLGARLNEPPPLDTEKGLARLLVSIVPVMISGEADRFVRTMICLDSPPTGILPKLNGEGFTARTTRGTPVPFKVTVQLVELTAVQLVTLVALCVMDSVCVKDPEDVGEKPTTTGWDSPGASSNVTFPGPENGLEKEPRVPVSFPVELDRLMIVKTCLGDLPATTSSKFTGLGLTSIWITGGIPLPDKDTFTGLPGLEAL